MAPGKKNAVVAWIRQILGGFRAAWQWVLKEVEFLTRAPGRWLWRTAKGAWRTLVRFLRWIVVLPVLLVASVIRWAAGLTLYRIFRIAWRAALVVVVILAVGFFASVHWPHSQVPKAEPQIPIVYLDQGEGWSGGREAPNRQLYYYTPQGTGNVLKNMRYKWFVNLELPWGRQKLASPEQMRAYGFQVDNGTTPNNPHKLPVGFTRHYDPALKAEVLDVTCATCHTGALRVARPDGTRVSLRIDGGQAMHAFTAANMPHFVPVLLASMVSTYVNPLKFNRFARRVLGPDHYESGKDALRDEFRKTLGALLAMGKNEKLHGLAPVEEGYARTDALTRIANMVFGDHITPDNYKKGTAPVSYPPVWDIWKFDWVQYSASVAQPMARNLGESLGVGATYAFTDPTGVPLPAEERYRTTTRLRDLHDIEIALRRLRPPAWPEDLLGKVDRDQAVRGGLAFIRTCQGCHGPHPASDRQRTIEMPGKNLEDGTTLPHWKLKTLTVQEIGTDPNAAVNFVELKFDLTPTGLTDEEVRAVVGDELRQRMQRELKYDFQDDPGKGYCSPLDEFPEAYRKYSFVDRETCAQAWRDNIARDLDAINLSSTTNGQGLNYFGLMMRKKLYELEGISKDEQEELNGFDALDLPQVLMAYKARPLAGAWATAPYMHNGSIRNLYQVLSPQHERDARFFIGRPEFDPVRVGLARADAKDGGFWYDTTVSGNANTGHEFRAGYTQWKKGNPPQFGVIGREYSHDERMEIIEYLKAHHDDPPHSTLFGEVFEGVVAEVRRTLPDVPAQVPWVWPEGQACNLREYMVNQFPDAATEAPEAPGDAQAVTAEAGTASPGDGLETDVRTIVRRLDAYFALKGSYQCGGKTRYQRGG